MGIDRTHLLWLFTNLIFFRFYSYTPVNAGALGYGPRDGMLTINFFTDFLPNLRLIEYICRKNLTTWIDYIQQTLVQQMHFGH